MFNPYCMKIVEHAIPFIPTAAHVLEFGNQRLDKSLPGKDTRDLYLKTFGCSSYTAVDVNTDMHAVIGDLNLPLKLQADPAFERRYELVTNFGTGEHVFNQAGVFGNAHDMCRHNGVMLHQLPFQRYLNHGFYAFNPVLFRDIARANEYDLLFVGLADRNAEKPIWAEGDYDHWIFEEGKRTQLVDLVQKRWARDVLVSAAFRKKFDVPFRFPMQDKYKDAPTDQAIKDRYHA